MEGAGRTRRETGDRKKKEREEGMSARYLLVCAVYLVKINIIVHYSQFQGHQSGL